jgi:uncharacterized membrane protein HdeD (DUF308 family)
MTTNTSTELKSTSGNSLWIGVILVVLGILGITIPSVSTIVVETWVALLLVSSGTAKLFYAFHTREEGGFVLKLLLGALYIGTGIMLFFYPLTGVLTLTLLLGSFLLTEGTFETILAFRLRPQANWWSVLGNGIITLLLGGFVWFQFPFDAPWLIGTFVGASVLMTGISRIMLALNQPSATADNAA